MTAVLAGLFLYPIKSAAGIACAQARLGPDGLEHDREWMIVDASGRFVTQREESRLALLATAIADGALRLGNPQGAGPAVDLQHGGEVREVQVWGATCAAFDAGAEVAQFLSDWLGRPLRLVRFDSRRPRLANQAWTAQRPVSTLFSDGFPMLVLSQASIDDLAARAGRDLPVQRFRPNLLLSGVAAYAEDAALELATGAARIALTKACTRCVITTIDHTRGERTDDEPLRTLKGYRFDAALRGVVFGRNAYATAGVGSILRRGDAVELRGTQPL
ncbi:MAG: MOSC N-terminal beta barrel domain-containing protein [Steroidobacteraceae bacterium]